MSESRKKIKLSRRFWGISPETRIVPSSKIYKKKNRTYDYRDDLEEYKKENETDDSED